MRILIVDDNEDSRLILKKTLEYDGYTVDMATNGLEALKKAKKSMPEMIISDILMPQMDGFRFCNEVKKDKRLREIPFVFYTATYVDPEDERLGKSFGASRYIIKPIESVDFLKIINAVLDEYKKKSLQIPENTLEEEHKLVRMYDNSLARKLQKKIKERLLYREIFTHSKDAVAIIDPQGFYVEQNPSHSVLIGYSDKEIRGKTPTIHIREESFLNILKELSSKGVHHEELISHTKSGSVVNIDHLMFPIFEENGKVICYVEIIRDITKRKQAEEALKNALAEVKQLKNRLQAENIYLQDEIKTEHNFEEIISCNVNFKKVLHKVETVAPTNANVLILGETGSGKELLARAVHNLSKRKNRPLVKVNCAAIPATLIESELFGHEKGAFTGAIDRKIGRFELADGGTIFLDEIGDLPSGLQVKLLRVLQDGDFERLGNPRTMKVDVRVIAATNRNLEKALKEGDFREDLYYRLYVFPIKSLPLRERKDDIPLLVNHFVKKFSTKLGKKIESLSLDVMESLQAYHWPGNVRELENMIERSVILAKGSNLVLYEMSDHFSNQLEQGEKITSLKENERLLILEALEESNWVVEGKHGAAIRLDIPPSTLRLRIKEYGLKKPL
jgi:PAS domain S-box-containing protein